MRRPTYENRGDTFKNRKIHGEFMASIHGHIVLIKIAGWLKVRVDVTHKRLMQQNCIETLQSDR